ncbi:CCR4-NOT transcription complex subunit 7, partial [Galemys pyrenaicus]
MSVASIYHSQRICELWTCKLDENMKKFVNMNTESPETAGMVTRTISECRSNAGYCTNYCGVIVTDSSARTDICEQIRRILSRNFNLQVTNICTQFKKHEENEIETQFFVEFLMTSGVILFKILANFNFLQEELDFSEFLSFFILVIYDIKTDRTTTSGKPESHSLLTGMAFFQMRETFFEDHIDDVNYCDR